ncbi:MAG: hypothetical protein M1840_008716 [Geoglossum simile]|nr:MAG: hypothetical protein M1840_008716 [Geoglossum simile]
MRLSLLAAVLSAASLAAAQRPSNTTICDFYTEALLKTNTASNQLTLLTLVVNTVVIGNYTTPNVGVSVPGILKPGTVNGKAVNLAPYFNGGFASTNGGGNEGEAVNFLDGGGATPLMKSKPADDDKQGSRQYQLLTHLYEFFGILLGCSLQGGTDFPAYNGVPSMYQVHKFMNLDSAQLDYFKEQVALSASSFGVAKEDVQIVGEALDKLFYKRCSPAAAVVPSQEPQLQSMCIASSCPLDAMASCSLYENEGKGIAPKIANESLVGNASSTGTANSTANPTSAAPSASKSATASGAAAVERVGNVAAVVGAALLAVAL